MRLLNPKVPKDHVPVEVVYWFDRRNFRIWHVYAVDADGNQVGDAQYACRPDLEATIRYVAKINGLNTKGKRRDTK